jgi:hypothetical protein
LRLLDSHGPAAKVGDARLPTPLASLPTRGFDTDRIASGAEVNIFLCKIKVEHVISPYTAE